jgi:hypothetical protein
MDGVNIIVRHTHVLQATQRGILRQGLFPPAARIIKEFSGSVATDDDRASSVQRNQWYLSWIEFKILFKKTPLKQVEWWIRFE